MAFTVPNLTYGFDALEPHIDTQTMQIHHGKHHAAYVNNLNKAIEGKKDLEAKSIEDLVAHINAVPENIRTAVRNNGGGHYNHSMFWETIGPKAGGQPVGELADAIKSDFGSFDAFKEKFTTEVPAFRTGQDFQKSSSDWILRSGRREGETSILEFLET